MEGVYAHIPTSTTSSASGGTALGVPREDHRGSLPNTHRWPRDGEAKSRYTTSELLDIDETAKILGDAMPSMRGRRDDTWPRL